MILRLHAQNATARMCFFNAYLLLPGTYELKMPRHTLHAPSVGHYEDAVGMPFLCRKELFFVSCMYIQFRQKRTPHAS